MAELRLSPAVGRGSGSPLTWPEEAVEPRLTVDHCLKCNICTAACPVMAVTEAFMGPKAVGPQAERFRHPHLPIPDDSVSWCSACGTCSRVCPHGVAVAEINLQAKARLVEQRGAPLRDRLISRPEMIGRLARPLARAFNWALESRPLRWALEATFGIHRQAPLPKVQRRTLRSRMPERCVRAPDEVPASEGRPVAYFHGCGAEHYEPWVGEATIAVLEALGCKVVLPPQRCCGLPLQSNGLFDAARRYARANLSTLSPFAEAGYPIIGSSTSCTLALKHDYRVVLGLEGQASAWVAGATWDLCEFILWELAEAWEAAERAEVPGHALYHAPCQLRSHGIGYPAVELLRRVPGLTLTISDSECCGVAGTYGLKRERYRVAADVGAGLFEQVQASGAEFVITDSESCRWWIERHAGVPAFHPVEILARSLGLESFRTRENGAAPAVQVFPGDVHRHS